MISTNSLTKNWILAKAKDLKMNDFALLEKSIRALYLLELLASSNLKFIFKGGTSLILLIKGFKRISIDIDIIIEKDMDLLPLFNTLIKDTKFNRVEENVRKQGNTIPKRHYKFYFESALESVKYEPYILLDVLVENNLYNHVVDTPIESELIAIEGKPIIVTTPTVNSILGDKMTAFAPMTTGVPFQKGKEIEIIKQLFDNGKLFGVVNDFYETMNTYKRIVTRELEYRGMKDRNHEDVLKDSFNAALTIALKGQYNPPLFQEMQKGISGFRSYILGHHYNVEDAILDAAKVAYLTRMAGMNLKIPELYNISDDINSLEIKDINYTKLNKLKKTNQESFFYWSRAIS